MVEVKTLSAVSNPPNPGSDGEARTEVWLVAVLVLALVFRSLGPFLQQSTGDSLHYVALAMKLQTGGMHGYNLRGVNLQTRSLDRRSTPDVLRLTPAPPADPTGDLVRDLRAKGLSYYDEPLHHLPYGYPLVLVATGRLTGGSLRDGGELVNIRIEPWDLLRLRPMPLAAVQWRWLVPGLLSSLGAVLLTYWLGWKWFGRSAGLCAAFLMAVHPVDILTAQRIWADDALMFFCLLALATGWRALERSSRTWAFVTGVVLGVAYLVKPSVLFLGAAVVLAEAVRWGLMRQSSPSTVPVLSWRLVLSCAAGFLVMIGHWVISEWSTYGAILHLPDGQAGILQHPWHQTLLHRPHPAVLYTIGLAVISPVMIAGWFCIRDRRVGWLLLTAAIFTVEIIAIDGREYRYVLPILPLVALAAGHALTATASRWKRFIPWLAAGQVAWSLYLTDGYAWRNWGEIMVPF